MHTDHLGTPEVMTDTAGNEVWRREQTPFGETVKIEGSITQNMRFLGQRYHEEAGLR
ncbi:MAG: RHS domain-containing protein [Gammaproteobacteria bacterium]